MEYKPLYSMIVFVGGKVAGFTPPPLEWNVTPPHLQITQSRIPVAFHVATSSGFSVGGGLNCI